MIKVLIERHIAMDMGEHYQRAARHILQTSMQSRGFICGESLKNASDANHRLVIASYDNITNWNLWFHSEERNALLQELRPMLEDDEKITILEHV